MLDPTCYLQVQLSLPIADCFVIYLFISVQVTSHLMLLIVCPLDPDAHVAEIEPSAIFWQLQMFLLR